MQTAQASAVALLVLELWATAAVAWDALGLGRAPNVPMRLGRPGTEETLPGFWSPGSGSVDKAVIVPCWDALLVMASGLDGDGLGGLDGLVDPVANALKIDCAVPLSAASVTHLLTEAPATEATVGNTHRKLQICSLEPQCLEPCSSSCPRDGCLASACYAPSPQAPA